MLMKQPLFFHPVPDFSRVSKLLRRHGLSRVSVGRANRGRHGWHHSYFSISHLNSVVLHEFCAALGLVFPSPIRLPVLGPGETPLVRDGAITSHFDRNSLTPENWSTVMATRRRFSRRAQGLIGDWETPLRRRFSPSYIFLPADMYCVPNRLGSRYRCMYTIKSSLDLERRAFSEA